MIPAGYLAATGQLNFWIVLLAGTFGSLAWATANYFIIGKYIGRPFIEKYGKYFLIKKEKYELTERLFIKNDKLYTFLWRLIPVVRHLISIPAWIFRMPFWTFAYITTLWAGLWCLVLLLVGYYFGQGMVDIFAAYTKEVSIIVVIWCVAWFGWILLKKNGKNKKED
jgi:membrane protein DedA with SNARE-associated domain